MHGFFGLYIAQFVDPIMNQLHQPHTCRVNFAYAIEHAFENIPAFKGDDNSGPARGDGGVHIRGRKDSRKLLGVYRALVPVYPAARRKSSPPSHRARFLIRCT